MSDDERSIGAKIKRYAKVSSAAGGFAARMAGKEFFGLDINKSSHASDLRQIFGNLKGPMMKVVQFLATVPDALPPEYAHEFVELQTNAPPMGWSFVKRRMKSELGPDWKSQFDYFEETPRAAASLGQVHYAKSHQNDELACKLQYPDMMSVIEADLTQLKWALSFYENISKALETIDVQEEIKARLMEELDYTYEADNIETFQKIFDDIPEIHIPRVSRKLSTKRLLTMSWMEGRSIYDLLDESVDRRKTMARHMFNGWYRPFYSYGLIHGDPHTGNYTFRDDDTVNLLDFGCIRVFKPSFVKGVIDLYYALLNNDKELAVHAYETWGFEGLNKELIEIITEWAKLLYDPLLDDRVRPIQEENSGVKGWETATNVHEQLSKAGGIRPPREFVFMDRAAVGIGSVLMRLGVELNWHQLFEQLISEFSPKALEINQRQVCHKRALESTK